MHKPDNLQLSWCEGLSGLILYLCLCEPNSYSTIIKSTQKKIFEQHLNMGTSFCHGLGSLLQTLTYVENAEIQQDILNILLTRSYRKKNELLVFQSENNYIDLFDFGVGTLGIYWILLGNKFPFDLEEDTP